MAVLKHTVEKYLQQKTAVLCARYQYRGVVAEVHDDHLVLANAVSVEVSGPSMGERATNEDPIGSSLVILYGAIEIIYQPRWAHAPLPGEN